MKLRIFKCKKRICPCGQGWIVASGAAVLTITRTHAAAIRAATAPRG